MIRLLQRKLIIPRGDTGSFAVPIIKPSTSTSNVAVLTIFDILTKTKIFEKISPVNNEERIIIFKFNHNETVNLPVGKYLWDIKFYIDPLYAEGAIINGEEVDSYYAGFTLPECEIRETGDNLLVSPDSPNATLTPASLDIISAALADLAVAVTQTTLDVATTAENVIKTNANVEHYPYVGTNNHWFVWNVQTQSFNDTGVNASGFGIIQGGTTGQLLKKKSDSDFDTEWGDETDPTVPNWAKQPTKPSYTSEEVGALSEDTVIPSNTSDLINDTNFISARISGNTLILETNSQEEPNGQSPNENNVEILNSSIISLTENNNIASMMHTPGTSSKYFILNNALYEATENIAINDVIIPETNCIAILNGLSGKISTIENSIDNIENTSNNIQDRLDELNIYLGSIENLTWAERMSYVRAGKGANLFPVGTQFKSTNSVLGPILWDVVAHDHFQKPEDPNAHTMTLMTHYSLQDGKRYITHAYVMLGTDEVLPAGSYCFTVSGRHGKGATDNGKKIYFTIENDIPAGGQMRHYQNITGLTLDGGICGIYASPYATEPTELVTLSTIPISGAIDLGAQGEGVMQYGGFADEGHTDYDLSDIRQWLNSDRGIGEWWTPATKWSCVSYYHDYVIEKNPNSLPNYVTAQPGFMYGMSSDFLSYVLEIDYPCAANNKYSISHNTSQTYTVRDKFILPSLNEVGLSVSLDKVSVGTILEYFENANNLQRIRNNSATVAQSRAYFTRQPAIRSGATGYTLYHAVKVDGTQSDVSPQGTQNIVIMCTLG